MSTLDKFKCQMQTVYLTVTNSTMEAFKSSLIQRQYLVEYQSMIEGVRQNRSSS